MKKLMMALLGMVFLYGCHGFQDVQTVPFTHTGCSRNVETKASGDPSELLLRYSSAGLEVTRLNALVNCGFQQDGLKCDVSVMGGVIHYDVSRVDDSVSLKCLCTVERMSSTVGGLKEGETYYLEYTFCGTVYTPIKITYSKSLDMRLEIEKYAKEI